MPASFVHWTDVAAVPCKLIRPDGAIFGVYLPTEPLHRRHELMTDVIVLTHISKNPSYSRCRGREYDELRLRGAAAREYHTMSRHLSNTLVVTSWRTSTARARRTAGAGFVRIRIRGQPALGAAGTGVGGLPFCLQTYDCIQTTCQRTSTVFYVFSLASGPVYRPSVTPASHTD